MTTKGKMNLLGMAVGIVLLIAGVIVGAGCVALAIIFAGTATKTTTLLLGFSGLFVFAASAIYLPGAIRERILYKRHLNGTLNILDTPISFL